MKHPPLWHCEKCGRDFANRNQSHAGARHDLKHHFEGKRPEIRALFDKVVAAVRALGSARRLDNPRFRKVQTISAREHVQEFRAWLAEAFRVGEQKHIAQRKTARWN